MVFRRIEYIIEGDWKQQQALNNGPMTTDKLWKKTLKHAAFFGISFLIGNTFLAYIIGSDELLHIIRDPSAKHTGGLIAMTIFSGVFYGNFAFFREQACTTVCPYGRLQGVLLDRKSIVIAYDHVRGEARGLFRKGEERSTVGKGDCIDCKACVHVCPTGIDIRNGTQLECVNCTACIDACDHMMRSVDLPTGLIRYASEDEVAEKKTFHFNTRMKAYTVVLAALVGCARNTDHPAHRYRDHRAAHAGHPLPNATRRAHQQPVRDQDGEQDHHDLPVRLELMNVDGEIKLIGKAMDLKAGELGQSEMFIILPKDQLQGMKTKLVIGVYTGEKLLEKVSTSFVGPINPNRP